MDKEQKWMAICEYAATLLSTCEKRQYFAVILDHNGHVLGTGYNGGPKGMRHCNEGGCERVAAQSPSGSSYGNCFTGETEFLTRRGVRRLRDAAGQSVEVLTSRGWKLAAVKEYGYQPTLRIGLRRNHQRKEVRATPEHRWFIYDSHRKRREVLTKDLRPNHHYLASAYARSGRYALSNEGIKAGLVFGDGSCSYGQPGSGSHIDFFGPAIELATLFGEGTTHRNLPRRWKTELPPLDESFGYLSGWLAGYFAADGTISNSSPILYSASEKNLEWVQQVCYVLGIPTFDVRKCVTGLGRYKDSPLFALSFPMSGFPRDLVLLANHNEKFSERSPARGWPRWVVESIEGDCVEQVFCVEEPETSEFTLTGNILVGNCIAIHAEANALLHSDYSARAGATLFVNGPPCYECAKLICNSGIRHVVYVADESYRDWPRVAQFFERNDIALRALPPSEWTL